MKIILTVIAIVATLMSGCATANSNKNIHLICFTSTVASDTGSISFYRTDRETPGWKEGDKETSCYRIYPHPRGREIPVEVVAEVRHKKPTKTFYCPPTRTGMGEEVRCHGEGVWNGEF